jgi:hypothetical protein
MFGEELAYKNRERNCERKIRQARRSEIVR